MKAYPAYKASEYGWIGDIPSHWKIGKLKHFAHINPTKNTDLISKDSDDLVTFLPMEKVNADGTYELSLKRPIHELSSGFTYFELNDVIVAKITPCFENGKGALLSNLDGQIGFGSTEFHVLRALPEISEPKFLYYLTQSHLFKTTGEAFMYGAAGQKRVPTSHITDFPFSCPSLPEQQAIADFLDCKTAQIDTLIEKKQRQIDLLQEQRTALINHAVTKGLNPDAPMKDSGAEWLGMIPRHWEGSIKLTMVSEDGRNSFVNGPFGSNLLVSELKDTGVPVIYIRDIRNGIYTRKSTEFVTPEKALELDVCRVDPGDLLIAKVGDPPGAAAVYPEGEPSGIVTQDVIRIKLKSTIVSPHYLALFLNSEVGRAVIAQITIESTRSRFPLGDFKNVRIPLPPVDEQKKIVDEMSDLSSKANKATRILHDIMEKLREYRTALISEAVTGKIDVRS